ncbi:hypothetical protein O0L34_g236 [Tuta absoluta]|nr:hypothetical protein O0L34_g236 [Tuta absoluta]
MEHIYCQGCLPLVVIFDVSDSACRVENELAAKLMHKHNVYINIRRKPKQGITSVVIKGIERCAGDIYEARRSLLGGKEPTIAAEIPESYNIPSLATPVNNFNMFNPFSPTTLNNLNNLNNSPCEPYNLPLPDLSKSYNIPSLATPVNNFNMFNPFSPTTLNNLNNLNNSPCEPYNLPLPDLSKSYNIPSLATPVNNLNNLNNSPCEPYNLPLPDLSKSYNIPSLATPVNNLNILNNSPCEPYNLPLPDLSKSYNIPSLATPVNNLNNLNNSPCEPYNLPLPDLSKSYNIPSLATPVNNLNNLNNSPCEPYNLPLPDLSKSYNIPSLATPVNNLNMFNPFSPTTLNNLNNLNNSPCEPYNLPLPDLSKSYNIPSLATPVNNLNMFNPFSPTTLNNLNNSPCEPYNLPLPDLSKSYNIPSLATPVNNFNMFNPFSPTTLNNLNNLNNSPCEPYNLPLPDLNYNMGSPMFATPPTPGGYPSPLSPVSMTPPVMSWVLPSPQPRNGQFHYPSMVNNMYKQQGSWHPMNTGSDMSGLQQPVLMQQPTYPQHAPAENRPARTLLNSSAAMSAGSSGYHSNFTGSTASLDTHNNSLTGSGADGSNVVSPSVSPISKTNSHSPAPSNDTDRSQQELASIISDLPLSERRAPGCEKKTLETLNKMSPLSDYRNLKSEANKAMRESVGAGYRVPTPRWSGYYFSHTSPGPINLNENTENAVTPEKAWNRSTLVRPNIVETLPSPSPPRPAPTPGPAPGPSSCRYQQLMDLLNDLGLHKYIDLFKKHELDMSTFASLNEADLTEIGVTAFGARRKMLLVIAELQKQSSAKSAAVGAERKLLASPPHYTAQAAHARPDRHDAW